MKRLLCWLLALCTVFSLLPLHAFAQTAEETQTLTAELSEEDQTTEPTEETTEPTEETTAPTEPPRKKKPVKPSLKVATGKTSGKPELSWGEDEGAVAFQVYRAEKKNGKYTQKATIETNRYVDTSATAGKTYYYKVRAVAEDNTTTAYSAIKSAAAKLGAPDVKVSVVTATGKLKLSWKKESGAKKFEVYRATSKTGKYTKLTTTTTTSYTDNSVNAGKVYYYKVKALHSKSANHSPLSAVISQRCVLGRPEVKLSNVAETGLVKLQWSQVKNAAKYIIFRAPAGTEEFTQYATVSKATFTDEGMEVGESYTYQVQAIHTNEAANSPQSAAVTGIYKLPCPNVKGVATETGKATLSWEAVPGAVNYTVKRATSQTGTYKTLGTVELVENQQSYAYEVSVSTGKTYYFQVIANGEDQATSSEGKTLALKGALSAPKMKATASATKTSIKVSWGKVTNANGYYVYRRKAGTADTWKQIGSTTSTSYTDKKASGKFEYCVAAYKTVSKVKHAGLKSDPITVRTLAGSSKVELVEPGQNWATRLTWKKVTGATGYEISYKPRDSKVSWKTVATVDNVAEYFDTVTPEKEHGKYLLYRVRAVYEIDGVTTYGPYVTSQNSWANWHGPAGRIGYFLSEKTDYGYFATLNVENHGPDTIRLYSSGARWLGGGSVFNRNAMIVDNNLRKLSYVDIKPGEEAWISLMCTDRKKNWYDRYSTIRLKARYCGQDYWMSFSRNYGLSIHK